MVDDETRLQFSGPINATRGNLFAGRPFNYVNCRLNSKHVRAVLLQLILFFSMPLSDYIIVWLIVYNRFAARTSD